MCVCVCVCLYTYKYAYTRQNFMHNTHIKQQKSLFYYQQKISKHPLSTFDHHQNIYMSEIWNTKTVAKFHYFHHRKFENLHLQPLPPNNPNFFPVLYLRFLGDEGFYEKMLTRQLCKKSLCCLPSNLNKF